MKKKFKIILIIIILIWSVFFTTDYIISKQQKKPIFCISGPMYLDGGTIEYYGLGYKVIKFNKLYDVGEIKGITRNGVRYTYLCPIWYSYDKAWEKSEKEAVEYSKAWYEENAETFIRKEDEPHFTELFEKYYGKNEAENLYNKIVEEINALENNSAKFTESQKEQVRIVIEIIKNEELLEEEKGIFVDWLKGINFDKLNDEKLQKEIMAILN